MDKKPEKIPIDTLIISDIHLGGFSTRCQELLLVLKKYNFKRLILNGDILNGLKFHRLSTAHWEVLSKLRRLTASCEVIWVRGNHDARPSVLSKLLGINVYNHYTWRSQDKKFLAIHGHQFDKFLINNYILSHIAYFSYNFIRRIDHKDILSKYIKENNQSWKRGSQAVAEKAIQTARLLGVDYVFCGHTHKFLEFEKNGVHYINDASWNEKPSGYITIKDAIVELHQVE